MFSEVGPLVFVGRGFGCIGCFVQQTVGISSISRVLNNYRYLIISAVTQRDLGPLIPGPLIQLFMYVSADTYRFCPISADTRPYHHYRYRYVFRYHE